MHTRMPSCKASPSRHRVRAACIRLVACLLLAAAAPAGAQNIVFVNSDVEGSGCTLSHAITLANFANAVAPGSIGSVTTSYVGCNTTPPFDFFPPSGPYMLIVQIPKITLTSADNYWYGPNALPPIANDITITGAIAPGNYTQLVASHIGDPAPATADAFRFFYVSGGFSGEIETFGVPSFPEAGTLTLQNVVLRGGYAKGGDAGYGGGGAGMGGAIFNQGTLQLVNVSLIGNTAQGGKPGVPDPTYGVNWGGGGMGQDGGLTGYGSDAGGFGGGLGTGNGTTDRSTGTTGSTSGNGGGGGGFLAGSNGGPVTTYNGGAGGGLGGLGGAGGTHVASSPFSGTYFGGAAGDGGGGGGGEGITSAGGGGGGFGAGGTGTISFNGLGTGGGGVGGGGAGGGGITPENNVASGGGGFGGGGGGNGAGSAISGGGNGGFGGGGGFDGGVGGFGGQDSAAHGGGGAGMGGAIFNHTGTVSLLNVTATGNAARGGGSGAGGSGLGAVLFNLNGDVKIDFSTLAGNFLSGNNAQAGDRGPEDGTVYSLAYGNNLQTGNAITANLTVNNSIVHGTHADGGAGSDIVVNGVDGAHANQSFVAYKGQNFSALTTHIGVDVHPAGSTPAQTDPLLGALSVYSGPNLLPVLPLGMNSPASFNADANNHCLEANGATNLPSDERGAARPYNGMCNAGAYQFNGDYIFANGVEPTL